MNRPVTTLFLIQSLDGKISTGIGDERDVDRDFPRIGGLKEGLHQYYELEQKTDLVSFNSGRVLAKVGTNEVEPAAVQRTSVSFVVVDNRPHLTANGVAVMATKAKTLYVVTSNMHHPAYSLRFQYSNIVIIELDTPADFGNVFARLRDEYDVERMTIQTGGEMNAKLLRADLIDFVHIVVAPALVGGRDTSSLVDGESLSRPEELLGIRPLKLLENLSLEESYVMLKYEVVRPTIVAGA